MHTNIIIGICDKCQLVIRNTFFIKKIFKGTIHLPEELLKVKIASIKSIFTETIYLPEGLPAPRSKLLAREEKSTAEEKSRHLLKTTQINVLSDEGPPKKEGFVTFPGRRSVQCSQYPHKCSIQGFQYLLLLLQYLLILHLLSVLF